MRNATIDALLEKGLIHERDGVLLETVTYSPDDGSSIDDKLNTIKSMSSSEHGVIVVAWPKTGNHFLMAIWMRWACPVSRTCRASKVVMSPTSMVNCSRRRLHLERIHALRRKWPRRLGQLCYPIHMCGHVILCAILKAK